MHAEIIEYLRRARKEAGIPDDLSGIRVVEFGSYDINGSPRQVFTGAGSWVGVDWRPGPGVDVVSLAHDVEVGPADLVLCCQMLEHDPHWELTVRKAVSLVSSGGWMIATWAGPGYSPHELDTAPPTDGGGSYYRNLSVEDVTSVVVSELDRLGSDAFRLKTDYFRGTLDACIWVRVVAPAPTR